MRITKSAQEGEPGRVSKADLALINALAQKELKAEEVYTFGVRLCDNEVDRDGERFPEQTLRQLAELFAGKAGLFDHQWSAKGQAARIYRTQLVKEEGIITRAGDPACYLKAWAYIPRTEGNRELIDRIDGGILKEVSVGCAVERSVCSVCGAAAGECGHVKGEVYNGRLCFRELINATDAFEWSFVAVPAQKKAGVTKGMKEELVQLEREAELGRRYLKGLRHEVARLGGLAEGGLEAPVLERIVQRLDEPELLELKRALERRLNTQWPAQVQLNYGTQDSGAKPDGSFLI